MFYVLLDKNREKIEDVVVAREHNSGRNHDITTNREAFENVAKFRYLGKDGKK